MNLLTVAAGTIILIAAVYAVKESGAPIVFRKGFWKAVPLCWSGTGDGCSHKNCCQKEEE